MAQLDRFDRTTDILADHWDECLGCGKKIIENTERKDAWAKFSRPGMPEGRVHTLCWLEKGPVAIAQSYNDRITDQAGMPRSKVEPRVLKVN